MLDYPGWQRVWTICFLTKVIELHVRTMIKHRSIKHWRTVGNIPLVKRWTTTVYKEEERSKPFIVRLLWPTNKPIISLTGKPTKIVPVSLPISEDDWQSIQLVCQSVKQIGVPYWSKGFLPCKKLWNPDTPHQWHIPCPICIGKRHSYNTYQSCVWFERHFFFL